jgi:hypothetical protein
MASTVQSLPEISSSIAEMDAFPFRRELSLAPLIAFWETALSAHSHIGAGLGAMIANWLRQAPELGRPIEDLGVFARHRELVETLLSKVIPSAYRDQDYAAAFLPFTLRPFYATPPFERLFVRDGGLRGRLNVDDRMRETGRLLRAYGLVLRKFYGIELTLDYPMILSTVDPDSGLDRHFSMQFDYRFVEVRAVGTPPRSPGRGRRRG